MKKNGEKKTHIPKKINQKVFPVKNYIMIIGVGGVRCFRMDVEITQTELKWKWTEMKMTRFTWNFSGNKKTKESDNKIKKKDIRFTMFDQTKDNGSQQKQK